VGTRGWAGREKGPSKEARCDLVVASEAGHQITISGGGNSGGDWGKTAGGRHQGKAKWHQVPPAPTGSCRGNLDAEGEKVTMNPKERKKLKGGCRCTRGSAAGLGSGPKDLKGVKALDFVKKKWANSTDKKRGVRRLYIGRNLFRHRLAGNTLEEKISSEGGLNRGPIFGSDIKNGKRHAAEARCEYFRGNV